MTKNFPYGMLLGSPRPLLLLSTNAVSGAAQELDTAQRAAARNGPLGAAGRAGAAPDADAHVRGRAGVQAGQARDAAHVGHGEGGAGQRHRGLRPRHLLGRAVARHAGQVLGAAQRRGAGLHGQRGAAAVWQFIKEKGFLGMIIPKEYGGKQFSAHGHSVVITKIATRSGTAAVTVCVPNSLGPAELLLRYGTEEQKNYFLPGLANGKHLPCFGLTGPSSGSDAANMRDTGVVCEQDGVLGIRATFSKRYITLAPVATCVGLAVDVKDPQGLLKGTGHPGITVALLERNHPGLQMGKRHDTISIPFMNGPVTGADVFIPMSKVIGGQTRVGYGWNMLMDCLAEGRSISLPAAAVAGAKLSVNAVGAYARVRKQFKQRLHHDEWPAHG
ncbi:hypothetical protein ON010_g13965 [Phytophthora cinnamomi]|nr:hypothetical protein ON010_g13965 [Phytophthora cinnamomi]